MSFVDKLKSMFGRSKDKAAVVASASADKAGEAKAEPAAAEGAGTTASGVETAADEKAQAKS